MFWALPKADWAEMCQNVGQLLGLTVRETDAWCDIILSGHQWLEAARHEQRSSQKTVDSRS